MQIDGKCPAFKLYECYAESLIDFLKMIYSIKPLAELKDIDCLREIYKYWKSFTNYSNKIKFIFEDLVFFHFSLTLE